MAEQDKVLAAAAPYVKLDGRLVYVTCSLLMEENEDRIAAFLAAHPGFEQVPTLDQIEASEQLEPWGVSTLFKHQTPDLALRLTPRNLGCDGFYVAVLVRRA